VDVMPYSMEDGYQSSGGTWDTLLQGNHDCMPVLSILIHMWNELYFHKHEGKGKATCLVLFICAVRHYIYWQRYNCIRQEFWRKNLLKLVSQLSWWIRWEHCLFLMKIHWGKIEVSHASMWTMRYNFIPLNKRFEI